jgi:hypothetical protein
LDEGDFQAHASGGDCAAESAVAAADDDEIEITGGLGRGGEIEGGESPGGERGGIARRWGGDEVLGEEDRVTPAVEAGEIAEREGGGGGLDLDGAAVVPEPRGALGAEGLGENGAVDEKLEFAGGAGSLPLGDPIFGADPDAVRAGGRKRD